MPPVNQNLCKKLPAKPVIYNEKLSFHYRYRLYMARLRKHVEDFQALRIEREACVAQQGCVAGERSGIT